MDRYFSGFLHIRRPVLVAMVVAPFAVSVCQSACLAACYLASHYAVAAAERRHVITVSPSILRPSLPSLPPTHQLHHHNASDAAALEADAADHCCSDKHCNTFCCLCKQMHNMKVYFTT